MSGLLVDADAIRALAEILTETGLTEIEVSEKDRRIRVARAPATVQAAAPAPAAPVAPVAAAPAAVASAAPADL
ncbi:acetyl-CoA carboxylase biotin carboxyl carrier protein, partial [Acetobacter okinawensis]|nr:acetyl-CoA carboxylase biotin carboxyl carrier protein [Acetobacter okinawensis]